MNVFWREAAERELFKAVDYVMQENPPAAIRLHDQIWEAAQGLADLPDRFRAGAEADTRELVVQGTPFIIVYKVFVDRVDVISVFHAARDIPRGR